MSQLALTIVLTWLSAQSPTELLTGQPDPAPTANDAAAVRTESGPCQHARMAVATWLDHLQPDAFSPQRARTCALAPPGMSPKGVERSLVQLKKVLDARGVYVRIGDLPDDPDYEDPTTGRHIVEVSSLVDEIKVIKSPSGWMISPETLQAASALYSDTFPFDLERLVQNLPTWTRRPVFGIAAWQLGALIFLFIIGVLFRYIVGYVIASQLRKLMRRFGFTWGDGVVQKAAVPIGTLALAGVLSVGIPQLGLPLAMATILLVATRTIAAISVVMLGYRAVDVVSSVVQARTAATDTKLDDQLVPILTKTVKIAIVIVGVIFVLQNLEINVTSLLTGLGLGGLAFALAAKDTVLNFFGSITIFIDQPFQIGDWVTVEGVEGVVEEVGMRSTRIRTFYNSVVTVPNGKFTDAIVDNYGLREHRRCSIKLGLTYSTPPDQIEAFCDGVRGIIAAHPATRKDYYEVQFSGFGDFALEVMLYFFFNVDDWSAELRARHEVYLDILRMAHAIGVEFAFPTQTLHLDTVAQAQAPATPRPLDRAALKQVVDAFGPGGEKVVEPGQRVHPGFYAGA